MNREGDIKSPSIMFRPGLPIPCAKLTHRELGPVAHHLARFNNGAIYGKENQ